MSDGSFTDTETQKARKDNVSKEYGVITNCKKVKTIREDMAHYCVNVPIITKSDDQIRLSFNERTDKCLRSDIERLNSVELQIGENIVSGVIKKYKCDICNKEYREKSNLNKHLIKHSSNVSFVCPTCNKIFTEKTNLNKHLVIHTGRRDYICNVCNLAYVRKSHLDRHFKVHLGEKNFNCTMCDKTFMYKANLKKHLKIHNRDKKYLCKICNKKYKSNDILINHMKIHLNVKNFVCILCGKKFIQKIHLTEHMRKNHENNKHDYSMASPTSNSTRFNTSEIKWLTDRDQLNIKTEIELNVKSESKLNIKEEIS